MLNFHHSDSCRKTLATNKAQNNDDIATEIYRNVTDFIINLPVLQAIRRKTRISQDFKNSNVYKKKFNKQRYGSHISISQLPIA